MRDADRKCHVDKKFNTDWKKIGPVLVEEAAKVIKSASPVQFQGLNFYGSYAPDDQKLKKWFWNTVNAQPGVSVHMVPREKKETYPECPKCLSCTDCRDIRGTEEKGIDVRMAIDMVKLAWVGNYDVAVLVSSDRDFIPVAELLDTRGIKVIHGAFPPKGHHLRSYCWGRINIPELREKFRFQG